MDGLYGTRDSIMSKMIAVNIYLAALHNVMYLSSSSVVSTEMSGSVFDTRTITLHLLSILKSDQKLSDLTSKS
jgi:hypothetical protein